jgi:hypothetical protein
MIVRWALPLTAALLVATATLPGTAPALAATGSPTSSQNLSANPVLADGTSGYRIVQGGSSLRRVSITDHVAAKKAVQVTSTASTTRVSEPRVAVTAGKSFSFASDVKASKTGPRASVSVSWFTAAGEFLSYNEGKFVPLKSSAWTRAVVSAAAPKRAAFGQSQVNVIGSSAKSLISVTQHDVRAAATSATPPPSTTSPRPTTTAPTTVPPTGPTSAPVPPPASTTAPTTSPSPAPAPPPAPAPSGTQVFNGDFESGTVAQYETCQTETYNGACRNMSPSYSLSIEPGHQGRYAARIEVRDGDQPFCCGERSQLVAYDTLETEGKDLWYDWSFMIDPQYPISGSWQTIMQWHSEVDGSPPLAFYTEGNNLVLQTRPRPNAPYTGTTNIWSTPFVKGQWMSLRLHVKWSSNASVGFAEMWRDGVQQRFGATPPENGNGTSCVGQQTCRFRNIYPGDRGNRAMVTYYRDASISGTGVVHVDKFVVATAESALNGSGQAADSR